MGGFYNRKDAEAVLNESTQRLQTGVWADRGRQRVEEFVETLLEAVQPSLAPTTWADYRNVSNRWLLP